MLNQFVSVGRIAKIEAKKENTIMTIEVPRSYKNSKGEYDKDNQVVMIGEKVTFLSTKNTRKEEE